MKIKQSGVFRRINRNLANSDAAKIKLSSYVLSFFIIVLSCSGSAWSDKFVYCVSDKYIGRDEILLPKSCRPGSENFCVLVWHLKLPTAISKAEFATSETGGIFANKFNGDLLDKLRSNVTLDSFEGNLATPTAGYIFRLSRKYADVKNEPYDNEWQLVIDKPAKNPSSSSTANFVAEKSFKCIEKDAAIADMNWTNIINDWRVDH
jgi:hypothetical protein